MLAISISIPHTISIVGDFSVEARSSVVVVARSASPSSASVTSGSRNIVQSGLATAVTVALDPVNFYTPLVSRRLSTVAIVVLVESSSTNAGRADSIDV